jgi:archaellum biogenesis ATPase FlaH
VSEVTPRIYDPAGSVVSKQQAINDVCDLPSVWELAETRIEWLIQDLIPLATITLITAESGTGKTWLAYAIAGAVAHGRDFAGLKVEQRPVLYLDGENPLVVVTRNLKELGIAQTDQLRAWGGWIDSPPPGPDDARIGRYVRTCRPLLIWDSLVEFNPGDEQSSTEMREFMKQFRALAHLGATIIILHHTGKSKTSKQYRGSTDIKAAVDTAYCLTGQPRDGKLHRVTLANFKSRIAPGQSFGFEFESGVGFHGRWMSRPTVHDNSDLLLQLVRNNPRKNGAAIIALAKQNGVGLGKTAIRELLEGGQYDIERGPNNSKLYSVRGALATPVEVPVSQPLM